MEMLSKFAWETRYFLFLALYKKPIQTQTMESIHCAEKDKLEITGQHIRIK